MFKTDRYLSSINPSNRDRLLDLQARMTEYYQNPSYHDEWIKGINADWSHESHPAQVSMCKHLSPGTSMLEVGCGDGQALTAVTRLVPGISYVGVDLNPALWRGRAGFAAASAYRLPFPSDSFDAVVSMYVIEHLVFPKRFIDEAWRVVKPGGRLLIIAPDFYENKMSSEHIGLSYGSGRDKLLQGKLLDAAMTAFDGRVRLAPFYQKRKRELDEGKYSFPILLEPRCFTLSGFVPDCDAVYPASSHEIINYLSGVPDYASHSLFHQDTASFGLMVSRQGN